MPPLGIGMLGYAFMGKAHSLALARVAGLGAPLEPVLVSIAGRDEQAVADAAHRYGYESWTTDWRELAGDERVGLLVNGGPNALHLEPTVLAAEAGKHVLCEKPLGRDADESLELWRRVAATGVVHVCGFNYRFVPALRLARELLAAGEVGEIRHVQARYLQDWGDTGEELWRFDREKAGSGALGDLATDAIDLVRYLVGEIETVSGLVRTFRPGRSVDDAVEAVLELEGGAVGTLEATRFATGRRNALQLGVNGSRGSLAFDLERRSELEVHEAGRPGFRRLAATEAGHPFAELWWPPGHVTGWGDTFVHEHLHLLRAIAGEIEVAPHGATFADGYRAAEVCDAIVRSSESGRRERIEYRRI